MGTCISVQGKLMKYVESKIKMSFNVQLDARIKGLVHLLLTDFVCVTLQWVTKANLYPVTLDKRVPICT